MPNSESPTITGPPSPVPVTKPGCENCRGQHLKCDKTRPTCNRCKASGRPCDWPGPKFRVWKPGPGYPKKQRWIKLPKKLNYSYIFESGTGEEFREEPDVEDVEFTVDGSGSGSDTPELVSRIGDSSRHSSREQVKLERTDSPQEKPVTIVQVLQPFQPVEPRPTANWPSSLSPAVQSPHHPSAAWSSERASPGDRRMRVEFLSQQEPQEPSHWPLTDRLEADLLRHFVQNLAVWLDLCDPKRSFATIVPKRAEKHKILLKAMLALSARHQANAQNSLLTSRDESRPFAYHAECIEDLNRRPVSKWDEVHWDENQVAAAIILRVFEEMEGGVIKDARFYLNGIRRFFSNENSHNLRPDTLAAASFAVGLRQCIYTSVMDRVPITLDLVHPLVDRGCSNADDYTWANRAVVHCADVLNWCWGTSDHRVDRHKELACINTRWERESSGLFQPYFCQRWEEAAFPEMRYLDACQVIGVQHHLLASLLLTRWDPSLPHQLPEEKKEHLRALTRRVCGTGLGNQWTPPGMFTACMAIAEFGEWFESAGDQQACLDLLKQTERDHARPTRSVQLKLKETWEAQPPRHEGMINRKRNLREER